MEETLKSARFLSRVLVGICATSILFAISPDPARRFAGPLQELKLLVEELDDESDSYQESLIARSSELTLKEPALEPSLALALGALKIESETDAGVQINVQMDLPEPPHSGLKIAEILDALESRSVVHAYQVTLATAATRLESAIRQEEGTGKFASFELEQHTVIRADSELLAEADFEPCPFSVKIYSPFGSTNFEHRYASGHLDYVETSAPSFRDWLGAKPHLLPLFEGKTQGGSLLPELRSCWNLVSNVTPRNALRDLENRRLSTPSSVSFLGFKVPRELARIAGPTISLVLLAYILAHVKHIRDRAASKLDEVRDFPWLPLFRGRQGLAWTVFSVGVFPVASNALLFHRLPTTESAPAWVPIVVLPLLAAVPILIVLELMKLRRELFPSGIIAALATQRTVVVQRLATDLAIDLPFAALLYAYGVDSAAQARAMNQSQLEAIQGIGPATAKAIVGTGVSERWCNR